MGKVIKTDVLVIGGGGAAARAALEARLAGAEVVLVTKGSLGAIGTRGAGATSSAMSEFGLFATPGWTGPLSGGEKPYASRFHIPIEQAFANIIQVGLGMADPKLARILVEEAAGTRSELSSWGASFGEAGIRSHGVPIVQALLCHIRRANITIQERTMIVDLLSEYGECLGAVGVEEMTGETVVFNASATVIATGGDANLFKLNLNPPCTTGDGYTMGYEAGAELLNLEFKQIFLGTVYPTKNMLIRALPPNAKLVNVRGEEFLQNYLPEGVSVQECLTQRQLHNPFSTRDTLSRYVDIGIMREVQAGGGTGRHGTYLDRRDSQIPAVERNEFWIYRGVDFVGSLVEVGVCHHSSLGGLRIDENAETTLPHLYAAGETAAGPHGADRMGGHMLLASQVFGARAGRHGATYGKGRKPPIVSNGTLNTVQDRIEVLRHRKGKQNPADVKTKLQEMAYYGMLLVKNKESLNKFLSDLERIKQELIPYLSVVTPQDLVSALELQNLLLLAELEAKVCLERTESRGPHYREDFPQQDDKNWLKSITVKKLNGNPQLDIVALDPNWRDRGNEKVKEWG
jgi:succinate dehydrogenase/fumarate reductase flavoprotein subunit